MHDPIAVIILQAILCLILVSALYLAFGAKSRKKGEYALIS